ncbi:MAG: glycosyltransferase family 4 protein [Candidatus Electronema sp. V4]|uniref:glycosyltransferase family 4 protein n=1 Tax=Candidatus Electronema sp. V4 TaxID=3454756 RepID=UPI0040557F3C
MRIGINTLFLVPGDVGGTEVYLRETLKAMAAFADGDTLVLFTNRENDLLLRADLAAFPQIEFHQLPCPAAARPLRILAEQFLLPCAVRKARVDALWSPGYTAPAVCFLPQAVTVHDLQYKTCPEDMSWIERTVLDILVQTACRRCQAVIAISNFSRQEIIRHGFAEGAKVHAVLNGVSKDFAKSLASEGEIDLLLDQLSVRRPFLLCVAHSYPHKNLDKLVDAFSLLQEEISHQLVLVGKGRRGEEAVRQSLLKIEPERALRLSGLTEQELRTLYQAADVFALPSTYEGFGLPVIEALLAGLPTVTVRAASLPEVGGEAAFYVDAPQPELLAEKIKEILQLSAAERSRRAEQGRAWAGAFTWERTAMQTLRILRKIAEEKR